MHPEKKRTLTMLACLYGMTMVFLLFLRRPDMTPLPYSVRLRRHVNAIPFRVIKNYWRIFTRPVNRIYLPYALTNFLGNILLFVPMGFFPPALCSSPQALPTGKPAAFRETEPKHAFWPPGRRIPGS